MKITKNQLRRIIREAMTPDIPSAYGSDPIRSAFDSGVGDAQDGMQPESYHDWIAEDPELMDAYDAGYEDGLNNPAPKSWLSLIIEE